ncbi:hypothetical protein EX30DRAFT_14231 [Ascodesmis nigricans]|uniref:HIT-type domain-containing protein n=1 Tax=Ascodesmis nigricans TaxID=341454 RepID=A0A4S2N700_9PEZI|nr:hypothetical protein EX30DRAFT_14231 [Ascodesmis nigricans]
MSPTPGQCDLCHSAIAKYKCPTCLIPYCSLACYKPHKLSHTSDPTATSTIATAASSITPDSSSTPVSSSSLEPSVPAAATPAAGIQQPRTNQQDIFAAIRSDTEVLERLKASSRLRFKLREVARMEKEDRAKDVLNNVRKDVEAEELMMRILEISEREQGSQA